MIRFTSEQMEIIRDCARRVASAIAWPNELAVYDWVCKTHGVLFEPAVLEILHFCAQEVEHQKAGALAVSWYADAWSHALERRRAGYELNLQTLNELTALIEPEANQGGRYRSSNVTIRGVLAGTPPEYIERDMSGLSLDLLAYQQGERSDFYGRPLTPLGLYVRFEEIHPRKDGNGREGKIIYNRLRDTLDHPEFPEEPAHFATST